MNRICVLGLGGTPQTDVFYQNSFDGLTERATQSKSNVVWLELRDEV